MLFKRLKNCRDTSNNWMEKVENERIFHALDEMLPENKRILSNYKYVGILYRAFENGIFKNWNRLKYLEKAGFMMKCFFNVSGNIEDE